MKPGGRYLNFGCGGVFHSAWVNVDMASASPDVMVCDLVAGLPFPDAAFDGAYSSHVLEHFGPAAGLKLLQECRRVLRPGGICRIVVPDLENQAAVYLEKLGRARLDDAVRESEYDWAVLELIDQMVRSKGGGLMYDYLVGPELPAMEFVAERIGRRVLSHYRQEAERTAPKEVAESAKKEGSWYRNLVDDFRERIDRWALRRVEGRIAPAIQEAILRQSGEVHRWAYDRFSMERALGKAGFIEVERRSYDVSGIPDFTSYRLDVDEHGDERRPHSLYMEGRA